MNSLYTHGLKQFANLNNDLDKLQSELDSSASLNGQITASIAALSRTIDDYESMAKKEIIASKKDKALTRVEKFKNDFKALRDRFAALKLEKAAQSASSARSNLLEQSAQTPTPRYRSNQSQPQPSSSSSSAYDPPSSPTRESPFSYRPNNPRPHQMNSSNGASLYSGTSNASAAYALREEGFVNNAETQLDLLISQGREVLGSLVEQRGWLKGTRKRLLDAANGIKGGRQVVGWVERRR
ncbi:Golgi SNAP receptor complex member [Phaffia rhodozyma]|uniref:Protein transport protein BOS1 n=1 Tax=Phaffia rhodozyma TaxID=264483 RepID=A0A0F7SR89_PHARH|nr:Golgi SNAP receptor complex member [Phaffia rhodozyma]